MTSRFVLSAITLALWLGLPPYVDAQSTHSMLSRSEQGFQTLHTLQLRLEADPELTPVGPTDRSAVFNDVPFDISLAAFLATDRAIMVHAERVADGSGAANYTRFEPVDWPMAGFRLKPMACIEVSADMVDAEHDLAWLRERGFNPAGAIWIEQYFLSDDAFNNEVVISLLVRGHDCDTEPTPQFDALRSGLRVEPAL